MKSTIHQVGIKPLFAILFILLTQGQGSAAPDIAIYTDSIDGNWQNWSWDTTVNAAAASPVRFGSRSMAVTFTAGWAGLYLHASNTIDLAGYDHISFWINGGSGAQDLRVVANGEGAYAIKAQANTWIKIDIPMTELGSPATLTDLYWQDTSGGAQPAFYLDEISLMASTDPPPPPPTPGEGPALSINSNNQRHAINDDIYGMNYADEDLAAELRLPVRRWGGNSTTRYNWQIDVYNVGSDWYFENIPAANSGAGFLPNGSSADLFVDQNRRTGTKTIMTVPLIGWTPKRRLENHPYDCGFKVSLYGAQQSTDSWDPDCGNGVRTSGTDITGNAATDTSTAITPDFVTGWISHLVGKYGAASAGGVAYYNLDNEPMLWNSTHRDVHPQPTTYDEMKTSTYDYAAAIKAIDPSARTLGPVLWGWCAYFYSARDGCGVGTDYTSHGNVPFVAWYLRQMRDYETTRGTRILDYLDLHNYPQADGVALSSAGGSATQALRLRSTRSLWDPSYIDESWISDTQQGGVAVQLIPRMKAWVNENYPGTGMAITEYNWGALDHINGALAQADILGIFGREGLDLATLWGPPDSTQPGAFAFRMYRNYDGMNNGFGDVSVQSTSADQGILSIYAAERSSDGALTIIVINKTSGSLTSAVSLAGFSPSGPAQIFRYSSANTTAIEQLEAQAVGADGFTATFASNSISLFVIPQGQTNAKSLRAVAGGSGSGTLSSTTTGVRCSGTSCSGLLATGSTAIITAAAGTGSGFGGWNGCSSVNSATCTIIMDSDKTVTAVFTLNQCTLTATASGNGSGTVSSTDSEISFTYPAATSGSASLAHSTSTVLTARAASGSTVIWSGDCSSTGGTSTSATCTVDAINSSRSVRATFSASALTVVKPNGGEVLKQRTFITISWSFTGNPGAYVKIDLLKGGIWKKTITSRTAIGRRGAGTFQWRPSVLETPGNDYTVRITSTSNNAYTDVSDAPFSIVGSGTTSRSQPTQGRRNPFSEPKAFGGLSFQNPEKAKNR